MPIIHNVHVDLSMASSSWDTMDNNCCIGKSLNGDQCHQTIFNRKAGLIDCSEFSVEDLELLKWRSTVNITCEDKICFHHKQVFLTRYENLQRCCIDPYAKHKSQVTSKYS